MPRNIWPRSPIKAYDALFGSLGQPQPAPGPDPNVELRDALVTLTSGELSSLQKDLSALTSEQTKLQIHLDAMQALKSGAAMAGAGPVACGSPPPIDAITALRAASAGQSDDFFLKGENYRTVLAAQLEVAANALLCNSAQVVAVQSMYPICNVDFNLVVPGGLQEKAASHHDGLSHSDPSGSGTDPSGLDPTVRRPFAFAQQWLMQQMVDHVLKILDQPDPADPGGHTVLDNTLIFMCSEIGDGAQHSIATEVIERGPTGPTAYLPLITLGGGGGAIKTQQVLNFSADRPAADVFLALCQAMGVSGHTASHVGSAVSTALATVLPCSTTQADRSCAAQFVDKYGKRLFRRPLRSDERERYFTFFDLALNKTDFKTAISWLTRALIQSPATVYRSEIGSANGASYTLNQYEIATELSYTFAGTAPSDAVLAAADAGQISSPEYRVSGANVLLQGSSNEVMQRFFAGWVGYGAVLGMTKTNVPTFTDLGTGHGLRDDMVQETRNFLEQVMVTQKGGPRELLTAPTTNPSTALAAFYGMNPGAPAFPTPAADYASVARPAAAGIGLLAQGSVLAALARPDGSSPTKRGLLVFTRLLCREKPRVPDIVPPLAAATGTVVTTRDRYEVGHATGYCHDCHKNFDPIGFGFEQFDEVGRYRATDNGVPVNSASYVPNGDAQLFPFNDLNGLAQGLANLDEVYTCASGYLTTYAFGVADECLGETRRADFVAKNLGFLDYFASLAAEPEFERRSLP